MPGDPVEMTEFQDKAISNSHYVLELTLPKIHVTLPNKSFYEKLYNRWVYIHLVGSLGIRFFCLLTSLVSFFPLFFPFCNIIFCLMCTLYGVDYRIITITVGCHSRVPNSVSSKWLACVRGIYSPCHHVGWPSLDLMTGCLSKRLLPLCLPWHENSWRYLYRGASR